MTMIEDKLFDEIICPARGYSINRLAYCRNLLSGDLQVSLAKVADDERLHRPSLRRLEFRAQQLITLQNIRLV